MKYLRAIILFIFPSFILSLVYRKKLKIGFSIIITEKLQFSDNIQIGHGNFIKIKELNLSNKSLIGHLNYIKGNFKLKMKNNASIRHQNKITSRFDNCETKHFILEEYASIQIKHLFDVTSNIRIGANTLFAGIGTQVWTHAFYLEDQGHGRHRIEGDINIGNNVNINSRCTLCCGINICSNTIIGANCCINKDIAVSGLYVNQPLRYIPYNTKEKLNKMKPYKIEGEYKFFRKNSSQN